jgi:hypothetical protein
LLVVVVAVLGVVVGGVLTIVFVCVCVCVVTVVVCAGEVTVLVSVTVLAGAGEVLDVEVVAACADAEPHAVKSRHSHSARMCERKRAPLARPPGSSIDFMWFLPTRRAVACKLAASCGWFIVLIG